MGLRVFQLKPYKLAMAYSLINIDGVQCLLEGSTGQLVYILEMVAMRSVLLKNIRNMKMRY